MLVNSLECESPLYFFINNHHQFITHQLSIIPCFLVKLNSIIGSYDAWISIMLGIHLLAIPPTTISDVAGQLSCWAAWAQQLVRPKKQKTKTTKNQNFGLGERGGEQTTSTINTGDHHHLKGRGLIR